MPQQTGITVVLADDHPAILQCVSEVLSPRCKVLAQVNDGRSAVEAVIDHSPDIAVLDIMMPELDGINVARELQRRGSKARIIVLTVQQDEDYIAAALSAGALGYVLKSRIRKDLLVAIDNALCGSVFVSPHPSLDAHPLPVASSESV